MVRLSSSDDALLWGVGTWLALELPIWYVELGVQLLCRRWGWGTKIQPGKEPDKELVQKTMRSALLDNFVLHPIIIAAFSFLMPTNGVGHFGPLPSCSRWVTQMVAFQFIAETLFYWTHRMLHHRSLYKCMAAGDEPLVTAASLIFLNLLPFSACPH